MAFLLTVYWKDAQLELATSRMWINNEADAPAVLAALKLASNAQITQALLSTPVPLVAITNNDATNDNVETARTKALVKMRGADAGSSAAQFAFVHIGIPAPIGSLINARYGDVNNAELQSLKVKVLSETGVQMDKVEQISYSR